MVLAIPLSHAQILLKLKVKRNGMTHLFSFTAWRVTDVSERQMEKRY